MWSGNRKELQKMKSQYSDDHTFKCSVLLLGDVFLFQVQELWKQQGQSTRLPPLPDGPSSVFLLRCFFFFQASSIFQQYFSLSSVILRQFLYGAGFIYVCVQIQLLQSYYKLVQGKDSNLNFLPHHLSILIDIGNLNHSC